MNATTHEINNDEPRHEVREYFSAIVDVRSLQLEHEIESLKLNAEKV